MRDPIVWFLLIGAVLFGADYALNDTDEQIVVDDAVRQRLATLWQTQTGNAATSDEVDSLVQSWLKEETMFREAMRLGLDRGDTIVRRRLVQKLSFLAEEVGVTSSEQTQQDILTGYYYEHQDKYKTETRYSFQQMFFSSEAKANQYASEDLAKRADWKSLGETSLLNAAYTQITFAEARRDFGAQFARSLSGLAESDTAWQGPIQSSYGYHFVRLQEMKPAQQLPYVMVKTKVVADYALQRKSESQSNYYDTLRLKYKVVYE